MRYTVTLNTQWTYQKKEISYRHRMGYSIITVQILLILLVRLLPALQPGERPLVINERTIDSVIELIEPTRQGRVLPAPPRPSVLPPEPVDILLDDDIIVLPEPVASANGEVSAAVAPQGIPVENPATPASVTRIVEAITPDFVRQNRVRLEVTVRFLVSVEGSVDQAEIIRVRKQSSSEMTMADVPVDEYDISDAIYRAALQWRFRPARHEGRAVRTYSTHIFRLGG
jgi:hypothetical protein